MKNKEIEFIKRLYKNRISEYGRTTKALGWPRNDQYIRFERLTKFWDLENKRIIDYGCGFGDLYSYLKKININFKYLGLDISPEIIKQAKDKYPDAMFELLSHPLEELPECDVVFACGTHALKLEDNENFIKDSFNLFKKSSKTGFCVTFLSSKSDIQHEKNYYARPELILSYAYKYSNRILLDNMYMPFEFSVFVDLREQLSNLSYEIQ